MNPIICLKKERERGGRDGKTERTGRGGGVVNSTDYTCVNLFT